MSDNENDKFDEFNEDEEEIIKKREEREKRKKIFLIAVGVVIGILILLGLVTFILSAIDNYNKSKTRDKEEKILKQTNIFPEADYDYNIFDDEEYMLRDRGVWFSDGVSKTVMTDANLKTYPVEAQFMYNVIDLIINGDYEEYNKIFTEDYIKKAGNDFREQFTMQKLFEIELEYIDHGQLSDNTDYWDIQLTYRIKDNNGTFRSDLEFNDEGARPVIYSLISDKEGLKVSNVLTKGQYNSGAYNN